MDLNIILIKTVLSRVNSSVYLTEKCSNMAGLLLSSSVHTNKRTKISRKWMLQIPLEHTVFL